jgi:hypothetical protein
MIREQDLRREEEVAKEAADIEEAAERALEIEARELETEQRELEREEEAEEREAEVEERRQELERRRIKAEEEARVRKEAAQQEKGRAAVTDIFATKLEALLGQFLSPGTKNIVLQDFGSLFKAQFEGVIASQQRGFDPLDFKEFAVNVGDFLRTDVVMQGDAKGGVTPLLDAEGKEITQDIFFTQEQADARRADLFGGEAMSVFFQNLRQQDILGYARQARQSRFRVRAPQARQVRTRPSVGQVQGVR